MLRDKAYAKAIFCLRMVCEALERLLIEQFMKEEDVEMTNPVGLLNLVKFCNYENLSLAIEDESSQKVHRV